MHEDKVNKEKREKANVAAGRPKTDADYEIMIDEHRAKVGAALNHVSAAQMGICICVRKRSLFEFDKEYGLGIMDSVSISNPKVAVHEPKKKVDGITKYISDVNFTFDNTFNENENSQDMY